MSLGSVSCSVRKLIAKSGWFWFKRLRSEREKLPLLRKALFGETETAKTITEISV